MCHASSSDILCPFYGLDRGKLTWQPDAQDLQDTRMLHQELRGQLRHRTELRWRRIGRDDHGQRVVLVDDDYYFVAGASGVGSNCLIHTLRQCLGVIVNVDAVRADLMREFTTPCSPTCHPSGARCTRACTKVYEENYLNTDHWEAVVRLLGRHCATGRLRLDASHFCVRVLELTWQDNGVVLGNPLAPRRLTVARENGNHFLPVLRFQVDVRARAWHPW